MTRPKRGRPPTLAEPMAKLNIRLPASVVTQLRIMATLDGRPLAQYIARIVVQAAAKLPT
jgi:predicted HicB family RNase H-like nuclease